MTALLWWFAFLLAVAGDAFFNSVETGAYCVNRTRLHCALERGRRHAAAVSSLLASMQTTIATSLVGTNCSVYLATALVTKALASRGTGSPEIIATVILTPLLFVFAEATPKTISARHADTLFYRLAPVAWVFRVVFRPITAALGLVVAMWTRLLGAPDADDETVLSRRRLRFLFLAGSEDGVLTRYQSTLAENVMALKNTPLESVMVPWERVETLAADLSAAQAKAAAAGREFSRFPVVDESGAVAGVVNVLDLWFDADDGDRTATLANEAPEFSRATPVFDALRVLQRGGVPMGIVRNGEGAPAGIVTAKDLVEEVCGELVAW